MIRFGRDITSDTSAVLRREWLVTNGIGGYAMGTACGARTRRYHGLLVAALKPPAVRSLLVAGLDAWADINGERYPLCSHEWAAGLLPEGYHHLESFMLSGSIPTMRWAIGDVLIEQRIWMEPLKNTTCISYHYRRGSRPISLQLIPLITYRDHHANTLGGADVQVSFDRHDGQYAVTVQASEDLSRDTHAPPPQPFWLWCDAAEASPLGEWWWSFTLPVEVERGLNANEDLFAPVTFRHTLQPDERVTLICTADSEPPRPWQDSLSDRSRRDQSSIRRAKLEGAPGWIQQLALAADQFVVQRIIDGQPGHSVIAGYPWFADWGRDTMIALPGLTLALHRPDVAESILRTFAHFVDQGMLPNRFPDSGERPEYNTVDATLWYFEAIRAYLAYWYDPALVKDLFPILESIIGWHERGTRYKIRVDPDDGLLYAGESGVQLTWMDVKIDDWVVTPRIGKPVEINALWHNALRVMSDLAFRLGDTGASERYLHMATKAARSFATRFWYAGGGYLYDVIDGPQGNDATLRPNQLIAAALPYSLLDTQQERSVVERCRRSLVTSCGLRSLAPDAPEYDGHYLGDIRSRDSVYHQGTVWSWLIGAFVAASLKTGRPAQECLSYLEPFADHLLDAGLGTISEIFDGDAPHTPRGCIAQAWGAAEVLRAWRLIEAAQA
jgi:predicted glycogen debranching enzyme